MPSCSSRERASRFESAQLRPAESFQAAANGNCLLSHECIVGRAIDDFVEFSIELIVAVDVATLDKRRRRVVHLDQLAAFERRDAICGETDTHCLDFSRSFEHFHDAFRRRLRNDDATSGSHLDQTGNSELPESLTHGRS